MKKKFTISCFRSVASEYLLSSTPQLGFHHFIFRPFVKYCLKYKFVSPIPHIVDSSIKEGGSVSGVNIGRLITTSVTSRHTSMFFKMAGNFLVRYFCKR